MSLVNDMLRDLEARKAPHQAPAGVQAVGATPVAKRHGLSVAAGIGILLAAGLGYWGWQLAQPPVAEPPAEVVQSEPPPAKPVAAPVNAQLPALQAARWQSLDDALALELELPEGAVAELQATDERSLTLALQGVRFTRPLPVAGDALISGISLQNNPQARQLVIRTSRAASFALEQAEGSSLLTISIRPQPDTEPVVSTPQVSHAIAEKEVVRVADKGAQKAAVKPASQQPAATEQPVAVRKPQPRSEPVAVSNSAGVKRAPQLPDEKSQIRKARQLLQQGRVVSAQGVLQGFIKQQPDAEQARALLVAILLTQQAYTQAEPLVEQGLALEPGSAVLRKVAARLAMAQQQPQQAVSYLSGEMPPLNTDSEYHALLASAQYQAGAYPAAAQRYLNLLQTDTRQPQWWLGLGLALEQQGQLTQAANAYQSLARLPVASEAQRIYARQRLAQISSGG